VERKREVHESCVPVFMWPREIDLKACTLIHLTYVTRPGTESSAHASITTKAHCPPGLVAIACIICLCVPDVYMQMLIVNKHSVQKCVFPTKKSLFQCTLVLVKVYGFDIKLQTSTHFHIIYSFVFTA